MIRPARRSIVRGVVVVAAAVAALAWDGAGGQVGDSPEPAAQISAEDNDAGAPPVGEGSDGGSVVERDGVTQARLGTTSVNVVTTSCPDSARYQTDLGLMEHMRLQSHCDFP